MPPRPQRAIAHLDLDCFYVQVEQRRLNLGRPPWTARDSPPAAVQQWDGLIAVNYAARAHGVKRGMRAAEASTICPGIVLVHVETISEGVEDVATATGSAHSAQNQSKKIAGQASDEVLAVVQRSSARCEMASIDEAYLDFTEEAAQLLVGGSGPDLAAIAATAACPSGICVDVAADSHLLVAAHLVQRLRDDIFKETGFTVGALRAVGSQHVGAVRFAPGLEGAVQASERHGSAVLRNCANLLQRILKPDHAGQMPSPEYERKQHRAGRLRLVEDGEYERWQVGLFAEEVGAGGKRRFKVDTLAGFVHTHAPPWYPKDTDPTEKNHLYEVILQDQPCWLYFDLEFSRLTNPELQPNLAMTAFDETLSAFCQDVLGLAVDENSVIVLESSTPEKFSKHVVVHRLLDKEKDTTVPLAFANNAQAGLFVNELVNYARANRECSSARHLFVQAPKLSDDGRETTLIDESVYSRNRSFRLLFQSKFAKKRRLELDEASGKRFFDYWRPHPSRALLETMVTFVPPKTELFRHTLIPEGFGHMDAKSLRVRRANPAVVRDSEGKVQVIQQDPLLNFLVRTWDGVRAEEEQGPFPPTLVQSCVEMDRRFLTVTLSNNRFCRCKGSSHISNHVYMVVDMERRSFYQKCFDPDCRGFQSPEHAIPPWILETAQEEELDSAEWERFEKEAEQEALKANAKEPDEPNEPIAKRKRISEGGA
ncbi:primpol [Symbiodinium sp. CCMP2456]|nr:primpol [Symbiodinium sp. CCMP2456]